MPRNAEVLVNGGNDGLSTVGSAWGWCRRSRGTGASDASGGQERAVDPGVGGVLAVVQALGVDAEQDFDAVPGPLGHAGSG